MVLITIVMGVYKPTYNWGAPHCSDEMDHSWKFTAFSTSKFANHGHISGELSGCFFWFHSRWGDPCADQVRRICTSTDISGWWTIKIQPDGICMGKICISGNKYISMIKIRARNPQQKVIILTFLLPLAWDPWNVLIFQISSCKNILYQHKIMSRQLICQFLKPEEVPRQKFSSSLTMLEVQPRSNCTEIWNLLKSTKLRSGDK